MTGPSMKNSTETARQRIEWCRVPIRMSYISYESTDQWKRSLGRHVRGLREYWLKPHQDGICLYILEYESGLRASSWDDVWAGPDGVGDSTPDNINAGARGAI